MMDSPVAVNEDDFVPEPMTDQRPTDDIAPLVPRLPADADPTADRRVPRADGGLAAPATGAPLVPDVS
jgi:hypothetical protein